MLDDAMRDIEVLPSFVGESLPAQVETAFTVLEEAWPVPGSRRRSAAIRLALDLRTWQSFDSNGLRPAEASLLMASRVGCVDPAPEGS